MEEIITRALELKNWAIVGATPKKDKYGYMVFNKLSEKGYNVFLVNPFYEEIEGKKVYKNLYEITENIDCVSMIVAPEKGKSYIEQAAKLGIKIIWFQPGAESKELIELCKSFGIEPVYNSCVMVALNSFKK